MIHSRKLSVDFNNFFDIINIEKEEISLKVIYLFMNYSKYIDHTLLKADATDAQILNLCAEAKKYDFASVCVNPSYVALAVRELKDTDVKVCTVIGFPLGATSIVAKAAEAAEAAFEGAKEIDMVINISRLKEKDDRYVKHDIEEVRKAVPNCILKVIIETCLLTDEEKERACRLSLEAGADFVKTSTGFSTGGATEHDVKLMRETVKDKCGVKASGGIRTKEDFLKMIAAGANRIGTSSGVKIVQELKQIKREY